jgi:hypothetical protein
MKFFFGKIYLERNGGEEGGEKQCTVVSKHNELKKKINRCFFLFTRATNQANKTDQSIRNVIMHMNIREKIYLVSTIEVLK